MTTITASHLRTDFPYRLAGLAGIASGLVLLINAGKRAGVIPVSTLVQLIAPLGLIFGLLLVTGIYLATGRPGGRLGTAAFFVTVMSLAGLVGGEFVTNLVFPKLPGAQRQSLLDGSLGTAFTSWSVVFLLGMVTLSAVLAGRTSATPKTAFVLAGVGAIPVALRTFMPEWALDTGLVMLAVAIGWQGVWLWRRPAAH